MDKVELASLAREVYEEFTSNLPAELQVSWPTYSAVIPDRVVAWEAAAKHAYERGQADLQLDVDEAIADLDNAIEELADIAKTLAGI